MWMHQFLYFAIASWWNAENLQWKYFHQVNIWFGIKICHKYCTKNISHRIFTLLSSHIFLFMLLEHYFLLVQQICAGWIKHKLFDDVTEKQRLKTYSTNFLVKWLRMTYQWNALKYEAWKQVKYKQWNFPFQKMN